MGFGMKKVCAFIFGMLCVALLYSCANSKADIANIANASTYSTDAISLNKNDSTKTDSAASTVNSINDDINNILLDSSTYTPYKRHVTAYRILNFYGDTTVWDSSYCHIQDSTFYCRSAKYYNSCDDYPYEISALEPTIIYDTSFINLNFGKDAITNYIPMADIPEFNRDSVAKLFSTLSGKPCSELQEYTSSYSLKAIGLPDDFALLWGGNFKYSDFRKHAHKEKDDLGNENCSIREDPGTTLTLPEPCYSSYHDSRSLPEEISLKSFQFFNKSMQAYKDTTISWKLVYKDQYGRGDTLDITTKFE